MSEKTTGGPESHRRHSAERRAGPGEERGVRRTGGRTPPHDRMFQLAKDPRVGCSVRSRLLMSPATLRSAMLTRWDAERKAAHQSARIMRDGPGRRRPRRRAAHRLGESVALSPTGPARRTQPDCAGRRRARQPTGAGGGPRHHRAPRRRRCPPRARHAAALGHLGDEDPWAVGQGAADLQVRGRARDVSSLQASITTGARRLDVARPAP